jgi:hypothetical protein
MERIFAMEDIPYSYSEYENIPWPERRINDSNGVFFCKEAPSYEELLNYFQNQADKRSSIK